MPDAADWDLLRILRVIIARSDCRLLPPAEPMRVLDGLVLPDDLRGFHSRCGGAVLFAGAELPWFVGVAGCVVAASPRLLTPQMAASLAVEYPEDLTNGCYVIADGGRSSSTDPNIVIDLHPDRLGRCYLAMWDTYGVVGEMPVVALSIGELLRVLLACGGRAAALPDRYGDAYEPRLPRHPTRVARLDAQWLSQWRDEMTQAIASVMSGFEARMGYPPDDNRIGGQLNEQLRTEVDKFGTLFPPDLATFSRVVGEVSLPDIGNGWFVLNPLKSARIGYPYNVDVVLFASDGGGAMYAVPTEKAGPVLRLREVGQTASEAFDGERVEVCALHLRAFLAGLRDAIKLFACTGNIADL